MGNKRKVELTKSNRVAIRFLMELYYQRLERFRLPSPRWEDFAFFENIRTGNVVEGELSWSSACQWQRLERKIQFFGHDKALMAEVWLDGSRPIFADSCGSLPTFWRVSKIRYRVHFTIVSRHNADAEWYETVFTEEETPLW
jgi:hypothetical protein